MADAATGAGGRPVRATFAKTVSESDVYLFAGITGDLSSNHVNEEAMRKTAFGRRMAHGALIVGYMSACSTRIISDGLAMGEGRTPVSLGYDRIRLIKPVFIGDTITIEYEITAIDEAASRSTAKVEVFNQDGALVAVATHIMKWVPDR